MQRLELAQFNRDLYYLTFGHHDKPPQAKILSKKHKCLNYKQYKRLLREGGDMALNNAQVKEKCPTVADIFDSPISKFITLAENEFGYGGTVEDLIVNYVHTFFINAN